MTYKTINRDTFKVVGTNFNSIEEAAKYIKDNVFLHASKQEFIKWMEENDQWESLVRIQI